MNKYLLSLIIFLTFSQAVYAQIQTNSNEPVEISADNSLEWLQNKKQYVANGDVEAKQGDFIIYTDKLIADYRENDNGNGITGNNEIWQLTAEGNVIIQDVDTKATGDKAVYNVETGQATLTGNDLKLTTPEQVITAKESMEYNSNTGVAKAIGNAKIVQEKNTLSAQTITANFAEDKNGKQVLKTANASGGITITTPDETLIGNSGVYNAANNTATITGNVKIVRGPNMLEGAKAEVNLTTNISKMFGEPNSGKRVKGIFFPSSSDKKGNN